MPCAAIIVASGRSLRMGFDKLAAEIGGIPVLRRSVEAFMAADGIDRVIVVCPQERFDDLLAGPFPKPLIRVEGGAERQDSVAAGIAALGETDELVSIHDGARPMIRPEVIDQCVAAAREFGAAALARPVAETLKKAGPDGFTREGIDRSMLWFTETPQIFSAALLRRAYDEVRARGLTVTDEVSAIESLGQATKLVPSPAPNPKITVAADLELAAALLR